MMTRQLALKSSGATYGGVCERSGCHLVRLSAGCRRNRSVREDARSPRPPPPRQHPTLSHSHSRPLPGESEAAPQRHRVADAAQDSRRSVRLQQLNAGQMKGNPIPNLPGLQGLPGPILVTLKTFISSERQYICGLLVICNSFSNTCLLKK